MPKLSTDTKTPRANSGQRPAASSGLVFVETQGLTRELPKRLLLKPNGQPFKEIQLGVTGESADHANWLRQLDLLLREEPVGGWEPQLIENKSAILDRALENLGKRLAEAGREEPIKQFLAEVADAAEICKRELDDQHREMSERYNQTQMRLRQWQQEYGREQSWLNRALAVLGALGGGQISPSEAGQLWNKRETYAKWREALRVASEVLAAFIETASGYARNLDTLVLAARQSLVQTQSAQQQFAAALVQTRPWTYVVDYMRLAQALSAEEHDPALLAELLAAIREWSEDSPMHTNPMDSSPARAVPRALASTGERLDESATAMARREVERALAAADIIRLIETEGQQIQAGDGPGTDLDPVVLVGENLLDQVTWQRPTWQLVKAARPRQEVVQITPNGSVVFEHPNLTTARYGDRTDRLGFLEAELDVALDELRLIREGEESFNQARQQREYFILEQVAEAYHFEPLPAPKTLEPTLSTPNVPALASDDGRNNA